MTQQEIKENMTQGTWIEDDCIPKSINNQLVICWKQDKWLNNHDSVANCLAITHAINNTYCKGINPESVPEMYNALQIVHRYLTNIGSYETAMNIRDILNKATL